MHVQHDAAAPTAAPWCPERDTSDNVLARRNLLLGLWAGRRLGLSGASLTAYAREVHLADFERPGEGDVIEKVARDLAGAGACMPEPQVAARLAAYHREALRQLHVTD